MKTASRLLVLLVCVHCCVAQWGSYPNAYLQLLRQAYETSSPYDPFQSSARHDEEDAIAAHFKSTTRSWQSLIDEERSDNPWDLIGEMMLHFMQRAYTAAGPWLTARNGLILIYIFTLCPFVPYVLIINLIAVHFILRMCVALSDIIHLAYIRDQERRTRHHLDPLLSPALAGVVCAYAVRCPCALCAALPMPSH